MVYLNFFNGELTLPGALAMTADEILFLFQSFVDDVNNRYRVHEEARDDIHAAVLMIGMIRRQNSNENPGFIQGNPNFIKVDYQGNIFKLRTLYDIVGWIFSVVGNVPVGATRENYYYPLMMIASVFCRKLVPDIISQLPSGRFITRGTPDVWMVMWFKQTVNNQLVTRVVLGATLDMPTQNIKDRTKDFRKNLLTEAGIVTDNMFAPVFYEFNGQDFGHCAESYPLLFICSLARDLPEICRSAEGISAKTQILYSASTSSIEPYYNENGSVKNGIKAPCPNCVYLMQHNGFTVARFREGLPEGQ